MPKYIDAEKLEKDGWWLSRAYQQDATTNVYETKKITDFPIADVVEVVRCKDCKHRFDDEELGMVMCPNVVGLWVSEDWFCADGERKETEDE